jgi:large subunit ribosomal protein L21
MYAVIETGGKQYRVEVGTELEVELLDVEPGNTITLDRVLLVADGDDASIGQPLVANAAVSAEVLRQARGDKVIAFKYRPKARRRVKRGHRQELTVLRISDITLGTKSAAKTEQKAGDQARGERAKLEAAAAEKAAADAELAAKLAARTKTDETPAKPKRRRATAAEPEAPAESEAPGEPETTTAAPAETPDGTEATAKATETKPKRTRAKASGTEATPAEAETEAEATPKPKRTRTTKKDE